MQVVRVEFVTHYNDAQQAVDRVSQMLPNLGAVPRDCRTKVESWNVYSVDETVVTKVNRPVEDGKVINVK
jgi:hypothetical protein